MGPQAESPMESRRLESRVEAPCVQQADPGSIGHVHSAPESWPRSKQAAEHPSPQDLRAAGGASNPKGPGWGYKQARESHQRTQIHIWAPQTRQQDKNQKPHSANKSLSSLSYGFSNSNVRIWELDHKEGWVLKNWCFWTVVLVKTLKSPLDCKENEPLNPKENQPWIFFGRTDAEAEAPILGPPDEKSQLIGKDPDVREGRRRRDW